MSLKKAREYLEHCVSVSRGYPTGAKAEEALAEVAAVELMAKRLSHAGYVDMMREERRFDSADTLELIAKDAA